MLHVQDAMDRIYSHGGVFIVFATARFDPQCITNALDRFGDLDPYGSRPLGADNWCLLSELRWLSVTATSGGRWTAPRAAWRGLWGSRTTSMTAASSA